MSSTTSGHHHPSVEYEEKKPILSEEEAREARQTIRKAAEVYKASAPKRVPPLWRKPQLWPAAVMSKVKKKFVKRDLSVDLHMPSPPRLPRVISTLGLDTLGLSAARRGLDAQRVPLFATPRFPVDSPAPMSDKFPHYFVRDLDVTLLRSTTTLPGNVGAAIGAGVARHTFRACGGADGVTEVPLSPEDPQMCAPENEVYNFASVWRSGKLFAAEATFRANLTSVRGKRLYSPAPRGEAKMFGVVPLFHKMPMPGSEDDHDDDDDDDIKRITSVSKPKYGRGYPRLELSAACGSDLVNISEGWDALPAHHAYTVACASTRCKWRDVRRFAGASCAFHFPWSVGTRNWPEVVIMTEGVWVRPTSPLLVAKPSFRIGLDVHMKVMGFRFGIEHAAFDSSIRGDSSETFSTYQVSWPLDKRQQSMLMTATAGFLKSRLFDKRRQKKKKKSSLPSSSS